MKVEFAAPIKDFDGNVIKDGNKDTTLSSISCAALLATFPDEQSLAAEEKYKRFKLGCKIADANGAAIDLSVEEIATLKKLIGKGYGPLIVGRAFDLLDPPPK